MKIKVRKNFYPRFSTYIGPVDCYVSRGNIIFRYINGTLHTEFGPVKPLKTVHSKVKTAYCFWRLGTKTMAWCEE